MVGNTRVLPEELSADGRPAATDLRAARERRRVRPAQLSDKRNHEGAKTRRALLSSCFRGFVATLLFVMVLDLTSEQQGVQSVDRTLRARSRSRRGRQHIDESGEFPTRGDTGGRSPRPAGGDDPDSLGRRRAATTSGTRSPSRRSRARARPWPPRSSSPTRSSPSSSLTPGAIGRRSDGCARSATGAGPGCVRAVGAERRDRRRQPADDGRPKRRRLSDQGPKGLGGERGSGRPRDRLRDHHARPDETVQRARGAGIAGGPRAGRDRVSRADGYAGHHSHGARRIARRPRPGLHGSRVRHRCRRRSGARARRSGISPRDCGRSTAAGWHCRAGARNRGGGARRRHRAREDPRTVRAARSRTSRRFSGCSPIRRPSSAQRGC